MYNCENSLTVLHSPVGRTVFIMLEILFEVMMMMMMTMMMMMMMMVVMMMLMMMINQGLINEMSTDHH